MQNQFLRFLAVGVLNTAFGYGLFAIFLAISLHYSLALALATVLGVLFNFKTFGALVFRSHDNKRIFRFILVYVVVYSVNVAGIALLARIQISPFWGGAAMLLPCALLAFVLQKKFVFNHE